MRHRGPSPAARHRASPAEERSLTEASPRFLGSFPRADVALVPPLPEIAIVGRSNVGKSSLLNALVGRRIARVSTAPGKTRAMNVYLIPGGSREHGAVPSRNELLPAPCSHYLLDLPGYGYARASKADRAAFRRLVAHTLRRDRLVGVVWLLDIRREPSADDRTMQDLLAARGARALAAITKSDKVPRGQRLRRERELGEALGLDRDQVIVTSARTGEGIVALREAIGELLQGGRAERR